MYENEKMQEFFYSDERVEKIVSRGMAEEFWTFGIEDFLTLLHQLINVSWKKSDGGSWGTFSYEEPKSISEEMDGQNLFPWITFDVLERVPSKSHKGLKPRQFEYVQDPDNPDDYFRVYRQWYDCLIEFAVFAKTNKEAIDTQMRLEALIHQYLGLFKEYGISDIVFLKETGSKSTNASRWNNDIPHRTIAYLVRIERIIAVRETYLKNIESEVRTVLKENLLLRKDSNNESGELFYHSSTNSQSVDEFLELYNQNYNIREE
ncbi:MAG: hypothetical protein N2043_02235 [Ignavibacterium sp.]|nr:hypothetical protein [Ignavibacterium sp.]